MREHCPGSGHPPLPYTDDDDELRTTRWTRPDGGSNTVIHSPERVICAVCHEPKRPLKDDRLSKHTRYVTYREVQERQTCASCGGSLSYVATEENGQTSWICDECGDEFYR